MTTILQTAIPLAASYIPNDLRPTLVGLSREDLAAILERIGIPEKQRKMRMRQLWHWIYQRGKTDFALMTDISKEVRGQLEEAFVVSRPEIVT